MPLPYFISFTALLALQAITTPVFLKAEIPQPCKKSLVWKMVCSTIFLATAVLAAVCAGNFSKYTIIMLVGFCFSWLGDFLLHVSGKAIFFLLGLISFLCGHLCYITAYVTAARKFFPDAPFMNISSMVLFIVVTILALTLLNNFKVEFGEMYLPCLIYLNVISIMLVQALALAFRLVSTSAVGNPAFTAAMLSLGSILFVVSDFTLALLTFVKGINKHGFLRNINIWTYFFAQMFLGLTILYISV